MHQEINPKVKTPQLNEWQRRNPAPSRVSGTGARVTVLMATWNRAHIISKAIESVRAQTFQDWELIIVDDGSTDDTQKIVAEWQKKEPRIVAFRNNPNKGISISYNVGLRAARGKYVAMIDDDDPWIPKDKLEKQVEFLDTHPDYVGCGAGVVVVNPEGKELYRYLKPETDAAIRKYMLFSNPMANSTTLFRLSAAKKVGLYDESSRYSGDRDFWLKMGLVGRLCNAPEYFSYYTMSNVNTSVARIRPHLKASLNFMKRYKGKYPSYYMALLLNEAQYLYSFLPVAVRAKLHTLLARLKRHAVG